MASRVVQTSICLAVLSQAVLFAGNAAPADGAEVTSKTVLLSGKPLGVGGGPRNGFGILNVCRADKIGAKAVEVAVATAFDEMGLSLDPPTLDLIEALEPGKRWRTSPTSITGDLMTAYNTKASKPLPAGYQYYVSYRGQVTLLGRSLTLTTVTSLNFGGKSSGESLPYTGDFDSNFFHEALEAKILKGIENYGCQ